MNVIDYVTEEVKRQGHNINIQDGIERVGWMLDGWAYALAESEEGRKPTVTDAQIIGKMVERQANRHGFRTGYVTVGFHVCPEPNEVPVLLVELFERQESLAPIDFYRAFEEVHPFFDGNGRTGKVLLNWVNGTLLEPIFPPPNLWGRPIRNP